MKRLVIVFCMLFAFWQNAGAEIRTWTDRKGREYEAEFVREMFDKVTLRETNGKEIRLGVDELSEHDQRYLRVMVPPEIEIDFFKQTVLKPRPVELYDSDNDETYIITGKVKLNKASRRPFTSRLRAELFLIGREYNDKKYILLSKTDSSFLFTESSEHAFESDPMDIALFTEYNNQRRGQEYVGHVLAISDAQGNLVKVETDLDWLADKVENLRDLYLHGKASVYSRYFDKETVTKAPVPRPLYYTSRQK